MQDFVATPIGIIRSPHQRPEDTPIQPAFAEGIRGTVEVFADYEAGLQDLEGFSHIHLLYWLHRAGAPNLTVVPFLGDEPHGVFATRHPARPNAIGMSLVRLLRREGRVLHIEDVDVLDGTPLLDIKPHAPRFDGRGAVRTGWLESVDDETARKRALRGRRR